MIYMAEQKDAMTMLEKLDACGQAAEQLTKTIGRFDSAGKRLEKSLSELTTFDKMLKGDGTIQTLLSSSGDIRKMLTHFEKNLPAFNEAVTSSRKELQRYRSDLDSSMRLASEMMPEIENLASLAENIKIIREMLKTIDITDLRTEIPAFQESLDRFVEEATKVDNDLGNKLSEIKSILPGLKELVKSQVKTMQDEFKSYIEERISEEARAIKEYVGEIVAANEQSGKILISDISEEYQREFSYIKEMAAELKAESGSLRNQIEKESGERAEQQAAFNDLIKTYFSDLHLQLYTDIGELIEEQMTQAASARRGLNEDIKPGTSMDDLNEALKNITFNVDRSKPARKLNEIFESNHRELPMIVMKDTWTGEYYFIVSEFDNDMIVDGFYYNNGTFDKGRRMPSSFDRYYPVYISKKD